MKRLVALKAAPSFCKFENDMFRIRLRLQVNVVGLTLTHEPNLTNNFNSQPQFEFEPAIPNPKFNLNPKGAGPT